MTNQSNKEKIQALIEQRRKELMDELERLATVGELLVDAHTQDDSAELDLDALYNEEFARSGLSYGTETQMVLAALTRNS